MLVLFLSLRGFRRFCYLLFLSRLLLNDWSLDDHRLVDDLLNTSQQLLLLLRCLTLPGRPSLDQHQLAHHFKLLSADISDLLLVFLLSFHLSQPLAQHHHVALR